MLASFASSFLQTPAAGWVPFKCELPHQAAPKPLAPAWACLPACLVQICGSGDDEATLLLCDRCDSGAHTACLGMAGLPKAAWFCKRCKG